MIKIGQRVKTRVTGETGKVIRAFSVVGGIILPNPLIVVRLDEPGLLGATIESWYEHELVAIREGGRVTA